MGVAYYITTDGEIDGFDPDDFNGKCLAKADDYFEKNVYKQANIKELLDFMGNDPREFFGDDAFDDDVEGEVWFSPEDGLKTISVLIDHLRRNSDVVPNQDVVLEELEQIEQVLLICQSQGIRWHMSMGI